MPSGLRPLCPICTPTARLCTPPRPTYPLRPRHPQCPPYPPHLCSSSSVLAAPLPPRTWPSASRRSQTSSGTLWRPSARQHVTYGCSLGHIGLQPGAPEARGAGVRPKRRGSQEQQPMRPLTAPEAHSPTPGCPLGPRGERPRRVAAEETLLFGVRSGAYPTSLDNLDLQVRASAWWWWSMAC